jgi:pyroglutamyl-peptidase
MKTVLLTGFEPFGGDVVNPSAEIAQRLHGQIIAEHQVIGAVLPCVFSKAGPELKRLLRRHRPSLVICLGLAAGRTAITPERVAVNIADARIPDNEGRQPVDERVVRGGPVAYWSQLPIKAIVEALRARGAPAEVSQSAGTFVCNHVFYSLMHTLARQRHGARGGFLHVPQPGPDVGLTLEGMSDAIRVAIHACLQHGDELHSPAGAVA